MDLRLVVTMIGALVAFPTGVALAAPVAPTEITAADRPNDGGEAITVSWKHPGGGVAGFEITRVDEAGHQKVLAMTPPAARRHVDSGNDRQPPADGRSYRYQVRALGADGSAALSPLSAPAAARPQLLHRGRVANLLAVLLFTAVFLGIVVRAKSGAPLFLRRIAGLEAIDDAVGRAAEMGRPVLFSPGLKDTQDASTVAAFGLLSRVAERAARLRTRLKVPNFGPLAWSVATGVTREAFARAGRPEDFDTNDVSYLTSRSFTYAAAVAGMMTRERTATNFLFGHFYAESLILAETGAATGAVQIGGTEAVQQLPFFVTTCDYTLIGEELFAAAAIVSEDPVSVSTIKAHDALKLFAIAAIAVAFAAAVAEALGVDGAAAFGGRLAALLTEAP